MFNSICNKLIVGIIYFYMKAMTHSEPFKVGRKGVSEWVKNKILELRMVILKNGIWKDFSQIEKCNFLIILIKNQ